MGKNLQSSRDVEQGNYGHAESKRGPCMPIWAIILVSILVCAGLAVGLHFLLTLRKSEDSNATGDDAPGASSNGTSASSNGTSASSTGDDAPGASSTRGVDGDNAPGDDAPGASSTRGVNGDDAPGASSTGASPTRVQR